MAMIGCRECGATISDSAKACPKCGAPVKQPDRWGRRLLLIAGAFIVAVLGLALFAGGGDPPRSEPATAEVSPARKEQCAKAMASIIGHSTVNYTDKQAYEAEVREKCAGLQINGQDLGKFGK